MANLAKLKTEITDDPLGRGYSEMTDDEVLASLRTKNREQNKASMTGSEIINNVDAAEWAALTADKKQDVWDVVHMGTINPFGVEADLLITAFGAGSDTIVALGVARVIAISRLTELGIGTVGIGNVIHVRS